MTTFVAFIIVGFIPLVPFIGKLFSMSYNLPFVWSCVFTGLAFFSVGAGKSRFVQQHWLLAGTETLVLGSCAASLAYLVGMMLRGVA